MAGNWPSHAYSECFHNKGTAYRKEATGATPQAWRSLPYAGAPNGTDLLEEVVAVMKFQSRATPPSDVQATHARGTDAQLPTISQMAREEVGQSRQRLGVGASIALLGGLLLGGCGKQEPAPAPTPAAGADAAPEFAAPKSPPAASSAAPASAPTSAPASGPEAPGTGAAPPQDPAKTPPATVPAPMPVRALAEFLRAGNSQTSLETSIEADQKAIRAAIARGVAANPPSDLEQAGGSLLSGLGRLAKSTIAPYTGTKEDPAADQAALARRTALAETRPISTVALVSDGLTQRAVVITVPVTVAPAQLSAVGLFLDEAGAALKGSAQEPKNREEMLALVVQGAVREARITTGSSAAEIVAAVGKAATKLQLPAGVGIGESKDASINLWDPRLLKENVHLILQFPGADRRATDCDFGAELDISIAPTHREAVARLLQSLWEQPYENASIPVRKLLRPPTPNEALVALVTHLANVEAVSSLTPEIVTQFLTAKFQQLGAGDILRVKPGSVMVAKVLLGSVGDATVTPWSPATLEPTVRAEVEFGKRKAEDRSVRTGAIVELRIPDAAKERVIAALGNLRTAAETAPLRGFRDASDPTIALRVVLKAWCGEFEEIQNVEPARKPMTAAGLINAKLEALGLKGVVAVTPEDVKTVGIMPPAEKKRKK